MRDMDETKIVQIEGIEFTLKVISRRMYRKLSFDLSRAKSLLLGDEKEINQENMDRIIKEDPDRFYDATQKLNDAYWELVRHGVSGHRGFKTGALKEIPFEKDGEFVSEKTIENYDLNYLLIRLASEIIHFNELTDEEKKS